MKFKKKEKKVSHVRFTKPNNTQANTTKQTIDVTILCLVRQNSKGGVY